MAKEDIMEYFSKISRLDEEQAGHLSSEEWKEKKEQSGIKYFKRKVLGFCGWKTTKSIEELAEIFHNLGMVENIAAGKKIIPKLYGKEFCCFGPVHINS